YIRRIHRAWGDGGIPIAVLAHRYAFSSERTTTDLDSHFDVPSKEFASALDLRLRPGTLDLVELDGRTASITRAAPTSFEGDLIFLRQDLLARHANGRHLIQIAWGERELDLIGGQHPEWMQAVFDERADAWRAISVTELDCSTWKDLEGRTRVTAPSTLRLRHSRSGLRIGGCGAALACTRRPRKLTRTA